MNTCRKVFDFLVFSFLIFLVFIFTSNGSWWQTATDLIHHKWNSDVTVVSPDELISTYHSLIEDSNVYLPLSGSLEYVFSCHAASDLQSVEEHVTVKPVSCSLQT